MKIAAFALAVLNIGSFAWSVFGAFRSNEKRVAWKYNTLVVVSLLCYGCSLYATFFAPSSNSMLLLLGVLGMALSLLFFWVTVLQTKRHKLSLLGSVDQPQHLYQTGIFRWTRHPFYFSYLLFYLSVCFATNFWPMEVLFLTVFIVYYFSMNDEEKKFAHSPLADQYKAYVGRTGRFFPKFWHKAKSEKSQ